ncbi:nicotinate-nucleotide--dimethylbenzimidazole phosphoribosyltransferase [Vibrio kanaloae]|uniref:Nicotinate-nucleotide--dimethylbenzimidazole phosphoribosyltransferase n=1 Tax=Vibrio kanaloae TaxID=170673 RepID=A0A4U1Y3P2_9VIBR|nr:nicotinate-nucleotide--dimethylbenzimidazole phosphoribosyltransferase [Vibrio kanaloae]TKE99071.1 nicotinate-nucleotide--dimethylbenzimidazole phosphoribosyltransferase [Vibrio kanaloae]TKF14067.1 nicotinate-nucleotide--dimethylbenzimidazole phosphoribosyltransferase [Vibrio kanaloae]TKF33882.1 nicotinate-nucleotide--dimethylbenzimidazole phosphoribosyltransferase [Vibrio kanaloae]
MLDTQYSQFIQHRIDQKTKPLGALGLLEKVAHQLALIQSQGKEAAVEHIELNKPSIIIFAGDHGIADEGVSIAPSAVTQQMVLNFLSGGAAINCFCAVNNIDITVVDTGILLPVESESPMLISQRLGTRTNNFANEAAMSLETVERGIELGAQLVSKTILNGSNIIMFGEMGIGNTSSASAILSALANRSAVECVGLGTGINNEQLARKVAVVEQGVARCKGLELTDLTDVKGLKDIKEVLAQVGGYEIVQMVGGFLGAYQNRTPILVDGFIVSVAAYVATLIEPSCRDYMIFAHRSEESGHKILLELLDAEPLLDLGLRLGEGTGAALAMPIIRAAAEFYNNMASFESAGVTV